MRETFPHTNSSSIRSPMTRMRLAENASSSSERRAGVMDIKLMSKRFGHRGEEKRHVDFVMPHDVKTLAAEMRRTALHVFAGPVMADHVERGGGELPHRIAEIARNRERF